MNNPPRLSAELAMQWFGVMLYKIFTGWDVMGLENYAATKSLDFIMLNIEIDNPELEASLQQLFGNNQQSIASAFAEFVQHRKIKQDIGVSITQLAAGEGLPLQEVMQDIRRKYE
ncbi:hypothetical protein RO575_01230 [Methylomonas sp. MO1]|uniref:hypothetical protein n=2 Tax=unclassified Methylomonas TaxID=2608980 RepID=UPI0028A30AD9|nr:hypothetical protein [Methylomonas sp. MO1]MDT4288168.1 hypothetical protein [Methylomonas sp. MO1]